MEKTTKNLENCKLIAIHLKEIFYHEILPIHVKEIVHALI